MTAVGKRGDENECFKTLIIYCIKKESNFGKFNRLDNCYLNVSSNGRKCQVRTKTLDTRGVIKESLMVPLSLPYVSLLNSLTFKSNDREEKIDLKL